VLELERLLLAHRNAPGAVRDALLARHADEAFFVLAAAAHAHATDRAVERAAGWPSRYAVLDRPWVQLIPESALPPLVAEAWAQEPDALLRETVGLLARDEKLLELLARDPARQVRRAVASNVHAERLRRDVLSADPAVEVRARAGTPVQPGKLASVDSARFAAALAAMDKGGVLAPDVAAALGRPELDEEGAMLAARVLPRERVVHLVRCLSEEPSRASLGLAAGLALRRPEETGGEEGLRDLVADAAKALSQAATRYGNLTGKARLALWLAEGLADSHSIDRRLLVDELCTGAIGGEGEVLGRSAGCRSALVEELSRGAAESAQAPPALLEVAWRCRDVDDATIVAMARRLARAKRRGQDLPDDEIDFDPRLRPLDVLEAAVLASSRQAIISPRAALAVVAMDARRVRYVLTALPQWRGRLTGSMLGRVLRQHAGAITAGRAEARPRASEVREWTERLMNDIELSVALGIGHITTVTLVDRLRSGRHKLVDGVSLASGAEARGIIEGPESIQPLLRWATEGKGTDGAALSLWLLLESYDRERPSSMIASAVDTMAARQNGVSPSVSEALALLERRRPGRLETVLPQTARGKATLASAMARAYRALGGLR
jgi:hypothetical protein